MEDVFHVKREFCLKTLKKYTSFGQRYLQSSQGDISKNYDRGLPTEPTFELYHKTPAWFLNKTS